MPGATARQIEDFGDATGYGKIGGEYFSLASETDLAPLLKGLEGDLCQSPHWGYKGGYFVFIDNILLKQIYCEGNNDQSVNDMLIK